MELGPYAAEIGLTSESLESGTVTCPSKVKVGLVFEILKYAKKVNVSSQQSARWILSLFADYGGNKDDPKLLDYVRRSASRKYCKREKVRGKKRQDFLNSVFELPTSSQLGGRENQHPATGDSHTLTKNEVDTDLTTMAKVKGSYSLRRHNQSSLELMMECEDDELSPWQIEASRRALDDYEKAMQRIKVAKARQMVQQQKTTPTTTTPTTAAAAPPTPPPSTRSSSPDVIIVGETPATRTSNQVSRTSSSQNKPQLHSSSQLQSSSVPTSMLTAINNPHAANVTGGKELQRRMVESSGVRSLSQHQSQPQEVLPRVISSIFANHHQPMTSDVSGSQNERIVTGTYGYGVKRPDDGEIIAIKRPSDTELISSPPKKKVQRKTSADSGNWVPLDEYYYGKMEGDPNYWEDKGEYRFKCWYCSKMLYNNVRTMMHMQAHIDSEKQQNLDLSDLTQCKHCYKQFDTPFEMQTHIEKVHMNNANVLLCRICEKDHDSRHALTNHMRQVHTACEMPYICQMCNFRSSMYSDAVDHFKKKHDSSQSILCLYCLKVFRVKFVSNGWGQTQMYYHHLLKHQSKTNSRKCPICKLTFFNSIEVKNHRRKDHQSNQKGVIDMNAKYTTPDQVMIKVPEPGVPPSKDKSVKSLNAPALTKVMDYHGMKLPDYMEALKCIECKTAMNTLGHFRKYIECSMCRFATSCSTAYATHMMGFHSGRLTNVSINIPTEKPMDEPMYCLCGFGSRLGNKIANHMVYCIKKTCYTQKPEVTWVEVDEVDEEPNYDDPRRRPGASILDVLGLVKKQTLLPGIYRRCGPASYPQSTLTVGSAFMKSIEAASKTFSDDSKNLAIPSDGASPKPSDQATTQGGDATKKESTPAGSVSEEGDVDAEFTNWRKLCIEEFELEPENIEKLINRDIAEEWSLEEWDKLKKNCLSYGFWFAITDYIYSCEDYTFVKILPKIFENLFLDPPENISNFLSRIRRRLKRGGVDWIKETFLEHHSNIGPLCEKLSIGTDVLEGRQDSNVSAHQMTKALALELLYYKKRNPKYTYSNLSVWMMNIFSLQKPPNPRELRFQLEGIHRLKNKVRGHKAEVVKLLKEPFEPVESTLADDLEDTRANESPAMSDSVEDSIHSASTDKKDTKDLLSDEELSRSSSLIEEDNREDDDDDDYEEKQIEDEELHASQSMEEADKVLKEGEEERKKQAEEDVFGPTRKAKSAEEKADTFTQPDSEKLITHTKRLHSELEREPSTKKNEASLSVTDERKKKSDELGDERNASSSPSEKRMRLDVNQSKSQSKESAVVVSTADKNLDQKDKMKSSERSSDIVQKTDSLTEKDKALSTLITESAEGKRPKTAEQKEELNDGKSKPVEQKANREAEFKQTEKFKSLEKKTEDHHTQKVSMEKARSGEEKTHEKARLSEDKPLEKARLDEKPLEKTRPIEKRPYEKSDEKPHEKNTSVEKSRLGENKPHEKARLTEKSRSDDKTLDTARLSEEKPAEKAKPSEVKPTMEKAKPDVEKSKPGVERPAAEKPAEKAKSGVEKPAEKAKPVEMKSTEKKLADMARPGEKKTTENVKQSEMKPAEKAKPAEVKPTEKKPADTARPGEKKPTENVKQSEVKMAEKAKPVEVKPAEKAKSVEVKPAEKAKPVEMKPAEKAKPIEVKPAEKAKPIEMKPAEKAKPVEVKPAEKAKPVEVKPTEKAKPVEVKPAEKAKPVEVKPTEKAKPVEVKPAEKAKPFEVKPTEKAKPVEVKPAEKAKPVEVKPAEKAKPVEVKPAEKAKPVEVKPAEKAKPVEVKPAEKAKPVEVKPVVEKAKPAEMKPVVEKAKPAEVKPVVERVKPAEVKPVVEKAKSAEVKPVVEKAKPAEVKPAVERAKPAEVKPAVERAKPAEVKPVVERAKPAEVKPVVERAKPAEVKPVAERAKPAEVKPVAERAKPAEVKPAMERAKPAEVKPAMEKSKPVEVKPAMEKSKPVEVKPAMEKAKPDEVKPAEKAKPVEVKPVEKAKILDGKPTMAQDKSTKEKGMTEVKKLDQSSSKCYEEKSVGKSPLAEQKLTEGKTRPVEEKLKITEKPTQAKVQPNESSQLVGGKVKTTESKPSEKLNVAEKAKSVEDKISEEKTSNVQTKPEESKSKISDQKTSQVQDKSKPTAEEKLKPGFGENEKPKSASVFSSTTKVSVEEKSKISSPLGSAREKPKLSSSPLVQKPKEPSMTLTEQKVKSTDTSFGESKTKPFIVGSEEAKSKASALEKKPEAAVKSLTDPKAKPSTTTTEEKPKQPLKSSAGNPQTSSGSSSAEQKPKISTPEPKSNLFSPVGTQQEKTDQSSKEKPKPDQTKSSVIKTTEVKPTVVKPAEVQPTVVKPAEVKPAVIKPAEVKPTVVKPAEVKPTVVKPAEAKPAETKPTVVKSAEVKAAEDKSKPFTKDTEKSKSVIKMTDDKSSCGMKTQVEPMKSESKIKSPGSGEKEIKDKDTPKGDGQSSSQTIGVAAKCDSVEDPCKKDNKVTVIKMASSSSVACPPSTANAAPKIESSTASSQDKPNSATSTAKSESTNSSKQISSSKDDKPKSEGNKDAKTGSSTTSSAGDGQTSVITPTKKVDDPSPTSESTPKKPESSAQKPVLPSPSSSSEKAETQKHEGSSRHNERSSSSSSSTQAKGSDRSKDYSGSARDTFRDRNQSQRDRSHDRDYRNPGDRPYQSRDDYADRPKYGNPGYDNRNQPPQRGPYGSPDFRGPGGAPGHFGGNGRDLRGGPNRGRGHPNRGFDNNWHGGRGGRGGYGGNYHGGGYRGGNYY